MNIGEWCTGAKLLIHSLFLTRVCVLQLLHRHLFSDAKFTRCFLCCRFQSTQQEDSLREFKGQTWSAVTSPAQKPSWIQTCVCGWERWRPSRPSSWWWSCGCWRLDIWAGRDHSSSGSYQSNTAEVNCSLWHWYHQHFQLRVCVLMVRLSPRSLHLTPEQQSIFSRLLLLVVLRLHADVLDLRQTHRQRV